MLISQHQVFRDRNDFCSWQKGYKRRIFVLFCFNCLQNWFFLTLTIVRGEAHTDLLLQRLNAFSVFAAGFLGFSSQPGALAQFVLQQAVKSGNLLMEQSGAGRGERRSQRRRCHTLEPLAQSSDVVLPARVVLLPLRVQALDLKPHGGWKAFC